MYVTAFNTTDQPVVIDDDGRTLDGGTWGPVETTAAAAKAAFDTGALIKVKAGDGDDLSPQAREAFDATAALEDARKTSPEETAKVADEVGAPMTKKAARAAAKEA